MKMTYPSRRAVYTMYHGDDYIAEGTLWDLEKVSGLKHNTLQNYASAAHRKRVDNSTTKSGFYLIRVD